MQEMNWRAVTELRLNEEADVRDRDGNPATKFRDVRVAIEGAFLHVDPRPVKESDVDAGDEGFPVYTVPAAAVKALRWMGPKRRRSAYEDEGLTVV